MSRTIRNEFTSYRKRIKNILGICNCSQCRWGRSGKKDAEIEIQKRRFRRGFKTNKKMKKGIYTD